MTTNPPNVITTAVVLIGATLVPAIALLLWHFELWPWILAVYAFCAITGLGIVACDFRVQRNDAIAEWQRLERELEARAPGVTMVPHVTFPAPVVAAVVERPDLRIVPPQRSDSWLERVMDEQAALGEDGVS